jgi:glycosyltransferase involved in cell wall biosynthesis
MKKIKILFIHHAAGWGGAPINMINCIKELDKTLFEVEVLLLKDSIVKEKLSQNNIPYSVCQHIFYKRFYNYFSHTDAGLIQPYQIITLFKVTVSWFLSRHFFASKVLSGFKYDIIHLNSSVLSDWVKPAKKGGKVIYHIQEPISKGYFGFRYTIIRNQISKYADKIIAISQDNALRINLPYKTVIIRNFIKIPAIVPDFKTNTSILYLGGAAKIKGITVLAGAIPLLNKEIKVILAGHYPNLKKLPFFKKIAYKILYLKAYRMRVQLAQLAKLENVIFVGIVDNIGNLLAESSVLISPFTVPHFSRPIIEAFAYGRPVIASNVSGMDELVENKVDGLLFNNGDAMGLANTINELLVDKEQLRTMGINGRKKALQYYAPEYNVAILQNIYLELCSTQVNS